MKIKKRVRFSSHSSQAAPANGSYFTEFPMSNHSRIRSCHSCNWENGFWRSWSEWWGAWPLVQPRKSFAYSRRVSASYRFSHASSSNLAEDACSMKHACRMTALAHTLMPFVWQGNWLDTQYSPRCTTTCFSDKRRNTTEQMIWMDGQRVQANGSLLRSQLVLISAIMTVCE